MKQEALFKKLGNILNELNEQYQFLSQNPEQLTELELELFLANASFLTDHIQIIKKLNLPLQVAAIPAVVNETINEPIVDEEISDELKDIQQVEAITFANLADEEEVMAPVSVIAHKEEVPEPVFDFELPVVKEVEKEIFRLDAEPTQTFEFILNKDDFNEDDKFDFEEKTAEQLFDRPLSKEEELILEQKKKVKENLIRDPEELEEDEVGPEPFLVHHEEDVKEVVVAEKPDLEPVAEEIDIPIATPTKVVIETTRVEVETEQKLTLNDILAGNNTGTRINETTGAMVTDLRAAINLNDKLLYIKDLFNGYNLAYAEAIDIANKMPNFDAADNFFQKNYAVKNNWADKQATVDKFYLLLNKRFKD